jgi:hypothetical protein
MSWRWRRSIRSGPFRISLSKKGIGYSLGIPGLRVGRSPTGKTYVSQSIPGTGLWRIKYFGKKQQTGVGTPPVVGPSQSPPGTPPVVTTGVAGKALPRSGFSFRSTAMRVGRKTLAWIPRLPAALWRGARASWRAFLRFVDELRTRQQAGWSFRPARASAATPPSPTVAVPSAPAAPTLSVAPPSAPAPTPPASAPAPGGGAPADPWWRQKLDP